jgi:uncharacterized lipoprotein YajG
MLRSLRLQRDNPSEESNHMKRSLIIFAAALTLGACEKKEENTELNTPAVEEPAPAPAPAATPVDTLPATTTTGM